MPFELDSAYLVYLLAATKFRRRGIATELLTYVLNHGQARGARRATLEVRRSNDPARLLYERFGFSVAGLRRAYYTKPVEDALVLWRENLSDPPSRP